MSHVTVNVSFSYKQTERTKVRHRDEKTTWTSVQHSRTRRDQTAGVMASPLTSIYQISSLSDPGSLFELRSEPPTSRRRCDGPERARAWDRSDQESDGEEDEDKMR